MRNFICITLLLLVAVVSVPSAFAQAQPTPEAKEKPSEAQPVSQPVHSYKLDYLIYEIEDGKRVNSRSYTLLLTDSKPDNSADVRVGSRVPIATSSSQTKDGSPLVNTQFQYLDVGVTINARLELRDGRLFLKSNIDTSGTAPEQTTQVPAPVIRQIRVQNINTAVGLGEPMLLTSLDDVVSKRRYQVEVTVTRL